MDSRINIGVGVTGIAPSYDLFFCRITNWIYPKPKPVVGRCAGVGASSFQQETLAWVLGGMATVDSEFVVMEPPPAIPFLYLRTRVWVSLWVFVGVCVCFLFMWCVLRWRVFVCVCVRLCVCVRARCELPLFRVTLMML